MIKKSLKNFSNAKKQQIVEAFNKKMPFDNILKKFNVSRNEAICILYDYLQNNFNINNYIASVNINENKFFIISNTHFGQGKKTLVRLKEIYNLAEYSGIKNIILAGDLFIGINKKTNKKYLDP